MKVLDAPQSPHHRPLDEEWTDDGELNLYAGVQFFWRHRILLIVATLIAAALGAAFAMSRPNQYTATSTLFLNAVRTPNPLAPEALSIEGVDQLANSDLIRSQVDADLERRYPNQANGTVTDFNTVLYKSTQPQQPYLPLIGLSISATNPVLAREAADTWAATLMAESKRLTAASRASAVDFIVEEYPKAAEQLNQQERNLEILKRQHVRSLEATHTSAAVSLHRGQLASREQMVVDLEAQRTELLVQLKAAEATVAALEGELKNVPQTMVVSKAITDEALWDAAAKSGKPPVELTDARLRTQQINPLYVDLSQQLADARVRLKELLARRPALEAQIEASRRQAATSRAALTAGERAIAELELQQDVEVEAKERELEGARAKFEKLEERIGDAQIVKANAESSLTLGASAEVPRAPSGPKRARIVGIAGLFGFFVGLLAGWIRDRSHGTDPPVTATAAAAK